MRGGGDTAASPSAGHRKKRKKTDKAQAKGGMGGRHAAATRDFTVLENPVQAC